MLNWWNYLKKKVTFQGKGDFRTLWRCRKAQSSKSLMVIKVKEPSKLYTHKHFLP